MREPMARTACCSVPSFNPPTDSVSFRDWTSLPRPPRTRHVSGGSGLRVSPSSCALDARRRHASGGAVRRKETTPAHVQPASEIIQTDVIVIGNGPSGIALSYMLSGHWPYYSGQPHSDESLTYRLRQQGTQTSLVEQDLMYLSDGLEGRSSNPVALLFDSLISPDADLGLELPSLLDWRHDVSRAVPHVVLGRREEGGIWQTVDGQMQTLSLGTWMQLPDYPFKKWLDASRAAQNSATADHAHHRSSQPITNRASMAEVQQYYSDYVTEKGLRPYFRNHTTVTSVHRLAPPTRPSTPSSDTSLSFQFSNDERSGCRCGGREGETQVDDESGERVHCQCSTNFSNGYNSEHGSLFPCAVPNSLCPLWLVCGYETIIEEEDEKADPHHSVPRPRSRVVQFCYAAKSVVLATGAFDRPNRLGVRGETAGSEEDSFVVHSFSELEARCETDDVALDRDSDPVVVIGAGLSAADAVISLLRAGVPVVHLFRRDPSSSRGNNRMGGLAAYQQLPANIYPEYAAIHRLMLGASVEEVWEGLVGGEEIEQGGDWTMVDKVGLYRAYPASEVVEFTAGREVVLRASDGGAETAVKASYVVVLIGSKPDLSFLPGNVLLRLGVVHGAQFIDPKHNPVDVDPWMYESRLFPGLYAMGPLVGDNFVRFLQGGALGITAHIWQRIAECSVGREDCGSVLEMSEIYCRGGRKNRTKSREEELKKCRIMRAIASLVGRTSSNGKCCSRQSSSRLLVEQGERERMEWEEGGQGDGKKVSGPQKEAWHLL